MILRAGSVWHPVDLAEPDRAVPRGQPSTRLAMASGGSAPDRAVALGGGRRDATPPSYPGPAAPVLVVGHPGDLPARRGHVLLDRAAFADVALLEQRQPGWLKQDRRWPAGRRLMVVDIGRRRVAGFVPILYLRVAAASATPGGDHR